MTPIAKPVGGKLITKPVLVLGGFACLGLFFLVVRFIFGLGAVTNMNDGYPWGIFIAYDVVVGTAFACGGYSMALLVYIFNRGEFHSAVRPALLASVFGYSLAAVSVFFDIGRWWQMYNIFLPGKAHINSVLFEVALCIALYVFVLWIEFTPSFLEALKAKGYLKAFNRILVFFIALGVLLPTMHQSSLGTLMVIAGRKLSPLWHTPVLPVLFLTSAIAMGYGIVMFEAIVSAKNFGRRIENGMLAKLSGLLPPLLLVYVVLRVVDLIVRGEAFLVFAPVPSTLLFWIEMTFFAMPIVLLWTKNRRMNMKNVFLAATSLLFAGAIYRFDAFLIAYRPSPGWHYFPSFAELSITLGLISIEIIAYIIVVKKLPVLSKERL